ncbi:hypothetical protein OG413_43525 [Streptomyces sp. NBC_01433]|uniref:hypothetical protein n=1 Tax=Streptomyces sp. NBC_01433 TaxID=2903864 RepID=UPI00224CBBBF|nr:hypothetical protein [Streptomyces sp. NBC_01433]MCX4682055.1 hypothetical protein [Streptomyces sp. NBC_01433]
MAPKKKTNLSHQQQIARALNRACGCGYQEALRRVAEAARKGLLPAGLDKAGREQAVEILLAADASLLETPVEPVPLSEFAPWAERALAVLGRFTALFVADLVAQNEDADERAEFAAYCEAAESEDLAAAWLYLGAGCIASFNQGRGLETHGEWRTSLDQLEQQIQENWRGLVGAVDFTDGFTTAEEVFQRDVWDLPTMTILAGFPESSLPATLRAWARACGSVAVGDAGRALVAFDRAREHRFASDLAQIQVSMMLRALTSSYTLPELVEFSAQFADALARHHIAAAGGGPDADASGTAPSPSAAGQEG